MRLVRLCSRPLLPRCQLFLRRCFYSTAMPSPPSIQWREGSERARRDGAAAFNAFLRGASAQLTAILTDTSPPPADAPPPEVHVVLGNEAADADSIISALVYAYVRHEAQRRQRQHSTDTEAHTEAHTETHTEAGTEANTEAHTEANTQANTQVNTAPTCFVPVVAVPRAELALRCDVVALLAALAVDVDAVAFVDEFPWRHAAFEQRRARLRLTLVDHNALSNRRVPVDAAAADVAEILDHHADLGRHGEAPRREVAFADGRALVASTCTLVAERLARDLPPSPSQSPSQSQSQPQARALAATLLLGVIALDSVNFDPRADKVTPRDERAAAELETVAFADGAALFAWLQAERFSPRHWAAFSLTDCLRCDYKEFAFPSGSSAPASAPDRKYGVSSVLVPLDAFARKAEHRAALVEGLASFCRANELQFLGVMAIFEDADGARRRQLLLFQDGDDRRLIEHCAAFLTSEERSLRLEAAELPASHHDRQRVLAFEQLNTGASRKQVVPLVQQALAKL